MVLKGQVPNILLFWFLHGSLQLFGTVPLFRKGSLLTFWRFTNRIIIIIIIIRIWEMLNRLHLSANVRQIEEQLATLTVGCITSQQVAQLSQRDRATL